MIKLQKTMNLVEEVPLLSAFGIITWWIGQYAYRGLQNGYPYAVCQYDCIRKYYRLQKGNTYGEAYQQIWGGRFVNINGGWLYKYKNKCLSNITKRLRDKIDVAKLLRLTIHYLKLTAKVLSYRFWYHLIHVFLYINHFLINNTAMEISHERLRSPTNYFIPNILTRGA